MWIIVGILIGFVLFLGIILGISYHDEMVREEKETERINAEIMIVPCNMLYEHILYKEFYLDEKNTFIKKDSRMFKILETRTIFCEAEKNLRK